jgi:adenosylmethionine-8-amino-7-oxononanoate aminotransferase
MSGGAPAWYETGVPHVWLPYTQMRTSAPPLAVARTDGAHIHLADGRVLIDAVSSWWTACHGYNHPHLRAALEAQARRLPHVMLGGLIAEPTARLAQRLAGLLPGTLGHVFFSESGSVSVEIAMKMAIQFWLNQGERGRTSFVCFRNGYHGDTSGAMSVCDPLEGMHGMFAGYLREQLVADLPHDAATLRTFDALLASRRREAAAVIMEPLVQCAGGMKMHSPEILSGIAASCRRHGVLLLLDEIATGFGRTGSLFACQQAEVVPDIITLSKALSGGTLPLAATVATDAVFDAFLSDDAGHALMHGPTFTGNPLACAVANASLDLFEREPRLEQARRIGEVLGEALAACRALPGVVDVRTKGAIAAIQLAGPLDLAALRRDFVARGVWLRPLGDVVYAMPPFVIEDRDLVTLADAMVEVVRAWSRRG